MFISFAGFYFMYRQRRELFWSTTIYMAVMIYVLSSWWSWWFGGSFGCRSMVDTYAIMAFPLAFVVQNIGKEQRKIPKYALVLLLFLLGALQLFQTRQYTHGVIHYVSMDKDAYWVDYFKVKGRRVWPKLSEPDHQLARLGIYYFYDWDADYDAFREKEEQEAKKEIYTEISSEQKLMRAIKRHAKRQNMDKQETLEMVVDRVYSEKTLRKNLQ
jgi:hypothetical protein